MAVSADLVRRANPGEKKRGYRGEKGKGKRRGGGAGILREKGVFVWLL